MLAAAICSSPWSDILDSFSLWFSCPSKLYSCKPFCGILISKLTPQQFLCSTLHSSIMKINRPCMHACMNKPSGRSSSMQEPGVQWQRTVHIAMHAIYNNEVMLQSIHAPYVSTICFLSKGLAVHALHAHGLHIDSWLSPFLTSTTVVCTWLLFNSTSRHALIQDSGSCSPSRHSVQLLDAGIRYQVIFSVRRPLACMRVTILGIHSYPEQVTYTCIMEKERKQYRETLGMQKVIMYTTKLSEHKIDLAVYYI